MSDPEAPLDAPSDGAPRPLPLRLPRPAVPGHGLAHPKPLFTILAYLVPAVFMGYGVVMLVRKATEEPEFGPMIGLLFLLLNWVVAGIMGIFFGFCALGRGECLGKRAIALVPVFGGTLIAVVIICLLAF